jgi:hypothetical protein
LTFVTFGRDSPISTFVLSEKMLEGPWQRPFDLKSGIDHVILLLRKIPTRLENSHFALSPTTMTKLSPFFFSRKKIIDVLQILRMYRYLTA